MTYRKTEQKNTILKPINCKISFTEIIFNLIITKNFTLRCRWRFIYTVPTRFCTTKAPCKLSSCDKRLTQK